MRLWALTSQVVPFLTLPPFKCAFQSSFLFEYYLFSNTPLSSHLLNSAPLSPSMSSLQDILFFHLCRSPIIMRPLWKLFSSSIWAGCLLQWNHILRNPCISHHLQNLPFRSVSHYNETILRNLCISQPFIWAGRTLQQDHFEKSLCFSLGQVAQYNKTTLKNLCIFYHFEKSTHFSSLWKICEFFTWAGHLLQQDQFEKSLYFSQPSKLFI